MWTFSFKNIQANNDSEEPDWNIFDESNLSDELLSEGSITIPQVRSSVASKNMDKSLLSTRKSHSCNITLCKTPAKKESRFDSKRLLEFEKIYAIRSASNDLTNPSSYLLTPKSNVVSNTELKGQISSLLRELSQAREIQKEEELNKSITLSPKKWKGELYEIITISQISPDA